MHLRIIVCRSSCGQTLLTKQTRDSPAPTSCSTLLSIHNQLVHPTSLERRTHLAATPNDSKKTPTLRRRERRDHYQSALLKTFLHSLLTQAAGVHNLPNSD